MEKDSSTLDLYKGVTEDYMFHAFELAIDFKAQLYQKFKIEADFKSRDQVEQISKRKNSVVSNSIVIKENWICVTLWNFTEGKETEMMKSVKM